MLRFVLFNTIPSLSAFFPFPFPSLLLSSFPPSSEGGGRRWFNFKQHQQSFADSRNSKLKGMPTYCGNLEGLGSLLGRKNSPSWSFGQPQLKKGPLPSRCLESPHKSRGPASSLPPPPGKRAPLTLQAVGIQQVLALFVALDPTFRTAHPLACDAPQEPLALVAVGGGCGGPHLKLMGCGAGDGVD